MGATRTFLYKRVRSLETKMKNIEADIKSSEDRFNRITAGKTAKISEIKGKFKINSEIVDRLDTFLNTIDTGIIINSNGFEREDFIRLLRKYREYHDDLKQLKIYIALESERIQLERDNYNKILNNKKEEYSTTQAAYKVALIAYNACNKINDKG